MLYIVYWRNFGQYSRVGKMSKDHLTRNKLTTLCGKQLPSKDKVERLSVGKRTFFQVSTRWSATQHCKSCFKKVKDEG